MASREAALRPTASSSKVPASFGGSSLVASSLRRLADKETPFEKDELLDVVHWIRQGLGLLCGLVWGFIPLVGSPAILAFLFLNAAVPFLYYHSYLQVDPDDYGGHFMLLTEGSLSGIPLFLVSWIVTYSLLNH
eukprot:jgi/Chlat1/7929/Chrsp68S00584